MERIIKSFVCFYLCCLYRISEILIKLSLIFLFTFDSYLIPALSDCTTITGVALVNAHSRLLKVFVFGKKKYGEIEWWKKSEQKDKVTFLLIFSHFR